MNRATSRIRYKHAKETPTNQLFLSLYNEIARVKFDKCERLQGVSKYMSAARMAAAEQLQSPGEGNFNRRVTGVCHLTSEIAT